LITAIAGMTATFLPWFTITSLDDSAHASITLNGFRGFGIIGFLAFAGVALMVFFAGDKTVQPDGTVKLIIISLGMIALLATFISFSTSEGAVQERSKIKAGAWLMLAAATGTVILTWAFKHRAD